MNADNSMVTSLLFEFYQIFDSIMIFVSFLQFCASSTPSITICEGINCKKTLFPDSLIFDLMNQESCIKMDQKIANHISRSKNVDLCFALDREIEIPLSLFLNRRISIIKSLMDSNSVIFTYNDYIDYSSTSIVNDAVNLFFKYIGKNTKTTLKLDELTDIFDSKEPNQRFIPETTAVVLLSNNLQVSFDFLECLEEIHILSAKTPSKISFGHNQNNIKFTRNFLQISSENITIGINIPNSAQISFLANPGQPSLNLKLELENSIDLSYYTLIKLEGFRNIDIDKGWSNDYSNKLQIDSPFLDIVAKGPKIPFDIKSNVLSIKFTEDCVISGNLNVDDETTLSVGNGDLIFTLTISKYSYNLNEEKDFPIHFAISKVNISRVEIEEMNFITISNTYPRYLMILNQMDSNPLDKEVAFLTSGNTPFFRFPNINYNFWANLEIQYTSNSNRVHAFQNGENAIRLEYNIITNLNQVEYSTYGDQPSMVKTNICISKNKDDCKDVLDRNVFDDGSDLATLYGFSENNLNYTIYYGDTDSKVIGLQNIRIQGMSITFVFVSILTQVNFIFPSDKSIIQSFEISGSLASGFYGDIIFNCHKLVFSLINSMFNNENFVPNYENCDSIELDLASVGCLGTSRIKNLTIIDPSPITVEYQGETMNIGVKSISNELIDNLTIVGHDF